MPGVVVLFPKVADAKMIQGTLVKCGIEVAAVCTSGAQALAQVYQLGDGILVCGYRLPDMMYSEILDDLPQGFDMLLVARQDQLNEYSRKNLVCLPMPIKRSDLVNTLEMMISAQIRRKRKQKRGKPMRSEAERKIIEDAKKLLMERKQMTEMEAHRYLQKCSMDSGTNLLESAQMIISLMEF